MADMPGYFRTCFHTGRLACLAMLVSGGIVLQILACALYNNWWPMLTDTSSLYSESGSCWLDATKFLTGASTIGSIAIPIILKHAGVIGWGAMALELSSFFVFVLSILCYLGMGENDGYSSMF